jgi:peptide/nickel transport system ATP-binding protein
LAADRAGAVPAARGCAYHARCPRKLGAVCEETSPPIVEAAPGHRIACHLPLAVLSAIPSALPVANPAAGVPSQDAREDVAESGSAMARK